MPWRNMPSLGWTPSPLKPGCSAPVYSAQSFSGYPLRRQVLQTDEAVRVGVHDAPTDELVAIWLQPSLSPRDHNEASCRRASACVLQALPQSGTVVRLGAHRFASKECRAVLGIRGDGQIPLPHVHSDHALLGLR